MNKNKYLGVWFFGLSKSGKTFKQIFKKKIKNNILVDGDIVRKKLVLIWDIKFLIEKFN